MESASIVKKTSKIGQVMKEFLCQVRDYMYTTEAKNSKTWFWKFGNISDNGILLSFIANVGDNIADI